jgi:hypothetical protein
VHSCRTAAGGPAGVGDWTGNERRSDLVRTASACPGVPFSIELLASTAHPSDSYVRRLFRAPADTEIFSFRRAGGVPAHDVVEPKVERRLSERRSGYRVQRCPTT